MEGFVFLEDAPVDAGTTDSRSAPLIIGHAKALEVLLLRHVLYTLYRAYFGFYSQISLPLNILRRL